MSFSGPLNFCSNFYQATVRYEGHVYKTAEHAYQAAKARHEADRKAIASCVSPGEAKRLGRKVPCRANWDRIKVDVMSKVLKSKFERDPELTKRLLATGDRELIEWNYWGDTFWGRCTKTKVGENHLGLLLMELRRTLQEQEEIES